MKTKPYIQELQEELDELVEAQETFQTEYKELRIKELTDRISKMSKG